MRHVPLTLVGVVCAALLGSCSILSKEPPTETRWFEVIQPVASESMAQPASVGAVTAADSVGQEMVWRRSDVELLFDSANLWADQPTSYVERAFADRFREATIADPSASGLVVDVRLERFGGRFRSGTGPDRAEVALRVTTRGAFRSRGYVTASVDLANDDPETLANGLSEALSAAVTQAIEKIEAAGSLERG